MHISTAEYFSTVYSDSCLGLVTKSSFINLKRLKRTAEKSVY